MMNQDNPYAMNQTCKVCGEPAAGFHFGAFTCEGCKSFFGRSYNNLSSISDCKNNGECIINKKNRTACKACRLRKCLMVGMSKSGSRYGRRSNWFKIHCLLQEQQQQAAAAMAAHQNNQQQSHNPAAALHVKPPGIPPPAAAAAALGMLGHAGAYPGLYPPRSKEELMMLSLEEYAKHPAASPSVSSPDSHNSDSSVEINGRGNPALMHLANKHGSLEAAASAAGSSSVGPPAPPPHAAHLRKDLPPFLPLPFPALSSMPVMPPPSFLPPSHLLFPGYHPALYQHAHAGLLKPSPEQQAAAAAVHQLFNNAPRFHPTTITSNSSDERKGEEQKSDSPLIPPRSDALNNNHIPNGSKAAEELTKRFYLDAVLKSQQQSPPPMVTKIPNLTKHDHSISALVTPNSESGRNNTSRQSNEEEEDEDANDRERDQQSKSQNDAHSNGHDSEPHEEEEEEEDLVVSMTPPHSPLDVEEEEHNKSLNHATAPARGQDNPIDLSMKTVSSVSSCLSTSNRCDSSSDQENYSNELGDNGEEAERELWHKQETTENCLNNNNNNNESEEEVSLKAKGVKRKFEELSTQQQGEELEGVKAKKPGSALDLTNK